MTKGETSAIARAVGKYIRETRENLQGQIDILRKEVAELKPNPRATEAEFKAALEAKLKGEK